MKELLTLAHFRKLQVGQVIKFRFFNNGCWNYGHVCCINFDFVELSY